jgi:uncharacterized membrane protein YozB (DUF420 family)
MPNKKAAFVRLFCLAFLFILPYLLASQVLFEGEGRVRSYFSPFLMQHCVLYFMALLPGMVKHWFCLDKRRWHAVRLHWFEHPFALHLGK